MPKRHFLIFLFFCLFFIQKASTFAAPPSKASAQKIITQKQYQGAKKFLQYLITNYPADQYWYLSIGRSLSPAIEILTATGFKNASELPFSARSKEASFVDYLKSKPLRQNLFEHFDHFLPSKEALGDRTLLAMDYSNTGQSVLGSSLSLKAYLNEKCPECKIKVLALSDRMYKAKTLASELQTIQVPADFISIRQFEGFDDYVNSQKAKPYVQYLSYTPFLTAESKDPKLLLNPNYQMNQAIKAHIQNDPHPFTPTPGLSTCSWLMSVKNIFIPRPFLSH